jgi:HAD superfamily hydrolase (TIGR01509 family)
MPIKALIFDFDGLIVDTERAAYRSWADLFSSYGVELPLDRWLLDLGTHGMFDACAELETLAGVKVDRQATLANQRAHHISLCEAEALRPGVADMIAAGHAAGLRMAVASSSSRDWIDRWLSHHQILEQFHCLRTRNDVERVKPAPDLFLSAAACLGVEPSECVVFEDSPNCMRAAAAAGMRCVAVPTALLASVELPAVALRLESLTELPLAALLQRLEDIPEPETEMPGVPAN